MIGIRPALQTDVSTISNLLKQMGYEMSTTQVINRLKAFKRDFHHLWVAEKEARVVGCIAFVFYEALVVDERHCHIDALVVDENYRGQGVGKKLMIEAETYAASQGCATIDLITSNHRRESGTHGFYQSLGYQDHEARDYSYFSKVSTKLCQARQAIASRLKNG